MTRSTAAFRSLLLSGVALAAVSLASAEPPLSGRRIVVDAGHGTIDFDRRIINTGKSREGLYEHRLTMEIALYLGKILEEDGATVFYTRNRDDYWREGYGSAEDNKARAYFANELNADALICIHCDWNPSRRFQGVTTYYAKNNSAEMGGWIQRQLTKDLKATDRGLVRDSFTILDHAEVPTVLVETGFLSNRTEGKKLLQPAYQKRVAGALASALRGYFSTR